MRYHFFFAAAVAAGFEVAVLFFLRTLPCEPAKIFPRNVFLSPLPIVVLLQKSNLASTNIEALD